ncbi:MAG TPA: pitrilysin family protein [Pseudolabrys sp.]|nr:pitrilysin family protein [Pseudolabrys sp.]
MSRRGFVFAAAASAVAFSGLSFAASTGPKVADFTLKNGLELVVIPDHRAPVVTHMIWYKVGAADEKPGKSGIAHFLEHLMFKGTAKHPAGQFSTVVARMGGSENAFTTDDYTGYYQRVPADQLKTVMSFEADRMTGLVLTDEVVLPERQVILEERNMRIDNNPRAKLGVQVDAALYLNSPYGKPTIGWRSEMEHLTREDAIAFYRRYYAPNNAVVVIAGDVDPQKALEFAQDTYGKIKPNPDLPPRHRAKEPPPIAARTVTLADARVEQPIIQRAYLVPSFATGKPGQSEALEVLTHILGTGSNSRLYNDLVMNKGLAVNAGAWYDSSSLGMTKLAVFGAPRPGVTLPQLEKEIDAVIAQVVDKGISAEELERSKTRLIADAVYAHDNQASMARWYGETLCTGGTVQDVAKWPDRIRAVTAADVQQAARQWLQIQRSVTGFLIKAKSPQAEKRS